MTLTRASLTAFLMLLVGPWSGAARADDIDVESRRSEARRLFVRGVEAATSGLWQEAQDNFAGSLELVPNASTVLNLAGCQVNTGQLVEARDNYARVLAANTVITVPREEVTSLVAALDARIPKLRVVGRSDSEMLLVDGNRIAAVESESSLELNPGAHLVELRRDQALLFRRRVELTEKQELVLDLAESCTLCVAARATPEDTGRLAAEGRSVRPLERTPSAPISRAARVLPWLALGVGAAGALTAAITGPLALREDRTLSQECGATNACRASDVQRADQLALLADIGLVTALTGITTSALGFWLRRRVNTRAIHTQPAISVTSIALAARMTF